MEKVVALLLLGLGSTAFADIKRFYWEQYQETLFPSVPVSLSLKFPYLQRVNPTNPADKRVFTQRYFFDSSLAKGPDSPVLLYLCGESVCRAQVLQGAIRQHAKAMGAYLVALEHRYYGKSQPFKKLTTANLKHLTSSNALADAAAFQKWLTTTQKLKGKWIVVGGSYAGSLAAEYRLKYPDLAVGALASSGPVRAKDDFEEYDLQVFTTAGPTCAPLIQTVVQDVEKGLLDPKTANELRVKFGAEALNNDVDFLYWIADVAGFAIQYGQRDAFCKELGSGDALEGYARFTKKLTATFGITAFDDSPESSMDEDASKYAKGLGNRPWYYQSCTEFGYWQVAYHDPKLSARSQKIDLQYHRDVCKRLFGITSAPAVEATNRAYYDRLLDSKTTGILFTNGSEDPWAALSLATRNGNTSNPNLVYWTIAKGSHCTDLLAARPGESSSLGAARRLFEKNALEWIAKN